MNKGVIFDLGNTLVQYFRIAEFEDILQESFKNVTNYLEDVCEIEIDFSNLKERIKHEGFELNNNQVRPFHERLNNIFGLNNNEISPDLYDQISRQFLKPIFDRSRIFHDTIPTLKELKSKGCKLGIISNLPWGSPSNPWIEELEKMEILEYFDEVVFCSDVGWRKPSSKIFRHILSALQLSPGDCMFVGDDPLIDVNGARSIGLDGVLIDRHLYKSNKRTIKNLHDLIELV